MVCLTFDAQHKKNFISLLIYSLASALGIIAGLFLLLAGGREVQISASSLMVSSLSFWFFVLSTFIPLALSFFFLLVNKRIGLYFLMALKTASFSYCACVVFAAFPHSGWLVQFLLLFSQWAEMCVYHLLWMQILVFRTRSVRFVFTLCVIALLAFILFEYFLIYPYTASLFYT